VLLPELWLGIHIKSTDNKTISVDAKVMGNPIFHKMKIREFAEELEKRGSIPTKITRLN